MQGKRLFWLLVLIALGIGAANQASKTTGSSTAAVSSPREKSNGEKDVETAFKLCAMIDASRIASAPCDVSGWHSRVTISLDVRSGEARQLCDQITRELLPKAKLNFIRAWQLRIVSPYSGDNSIAWCRL